jgi:serine/threonine protein kinase
MEYVQGLTLHEIVVTQGAMPWPQACDVIAQAAAGLHHAHKAGLVHRDIKPANLIVMNDGQAKILDFGLALLQDDEEAEFALAMIFGHDCLGTADYISPEQSLHSHDVDARADIYSLGCTLYFLLTGHVPFPLNTVAEKLVAQRMKVPPPISNYVSGVPEGVSEIIAKMMAKNPEDRYQTAREAAEALLVHAKRLPVPFDFHRILAARAREASRRMKANQKVRASGQSSTTASQPSSRTTAGSSITAGGAMSLSTQRLQNQIETDIDVSRAKPKIKNPVVEQPDDEQGRTTTMRAAESSLPAPVPAVLVPADGGDPIVLDRQVMRMGRSAECEIPWNQQGVSSKHCEFCFEGNWWKVTDLESKNGVQVNGADVVSRMLLPGDRLTIARTYHFRIEDPNAEKPRISSLTFWLWILALLLLTTTLGVLASRLF